MTGTPKCSDSVVVMSGMRAPPPADATATRPARPVAVQRLLQHAGEVGERLPDRVVELVAGEPDLAAMSGQLGDQRGGRGGRQPFLGRAALRAQPAQWTDRGGARHVDRPGIGQSLQDLRQHSLVDQVTGQLGVPDRLADRFDCRWRRRPA